MKVLAETSMFIIKREVEEMTVGEAQDVWSHLEPFFPGVCARASAKKRDVKWLLLARKMDLIRRKSQEG